MQELAGTSPSANLLTGPGLDARYSRTEGSATSSYLTDALGSTLALADSTGTIQTSSTSEPFGKPSATGAASSTPYQFTGREWDGTGLQYARARYYHPTFGRFISEDPLGFGGGEVNRYAYVGNGPVDLIDPLGLEKASAHCLNVAPSNTSLSTGTGAEFDAKITSHEGGGSMAIGIDHARALPGLYCLNLLGEPYTGLIGRERLLSAPTHTVASVDARMLLELQPDPRAWDTLKSTERERAVFALRGRHFSSTGASPTAPPWRRTLGCRPSNSGSPWIFG